MPIQHIKFSAAIVGAPGGTAGGALAAAAGALIQIGPVIQVLVGVPSPLAARLQAQNLPVPTPVSGVALIDTGATRSAVAETVAQTLGIQPSGVVNVGTAGGMQQQSVYSARFTFPGGPLPPIEFAQLTGVNLQGHVLPGIGMPLIALIGRDILSRFVMIYDGQTATVTLAF